MPRPLQLRRAVLSLLTLGAAGVLAHYYPRLAACFPHIVYLTGWLLLALCLGLTAYNLRKKLPFLPLLSSRVWLQFHAYAGLFAGVLFIFHLRFSIPGGAFNLVLAALFLAVTLSGIGGWWLSRVIPRRLTSAGGEVPFERIPIIRRDIRLQAEKSRLPPSPRPSPPRWPIFMSVNSRPPLLPAPLFPPLARLTRRFE